MAGLFNFENVSTAAFFWGALSAFSLPLGACLGILIKPRQSINSAFMAFGAGALLFALTIELFAHVPHHAKAHGNMTLVLAFVAAICGGLLFDGLNSALNRRGGFLRRFSQAKRYLVQLKLKNSRRLLHELQSIDVLRALPGEKLIELVAATKAHSFAAGQVLFREGDVPDGMYFLVHGKLEIVIDGGAKTVVLEDQSTFGELGILLDVPRTGTAKALTPVMAYKLLKSDFLDFVKSAPEMKRALQELAQTRLNEISLRSSPKSAHPESWFGELDASQISVSQQEIAEQARHAHSQAGGAAALAIWLGILIDGIPESLIIGMLACSATGMSLAFIVGVFLANLPEAMSSAVSMMKGGMTTRGIMLMWGSLCVLTGVGAYIGATLVSGSEAHEFFYFALVMESLAGGAMLTMIAETMLPEAFEQGGRIVGMSTLTGFLTALTVKILS